MSMPHPTDGLWAELNQRQTEIAVIGLGYVGLPLALCLAKRFQVVGLDLNHEKVQALRAGRDPVGENSDAEVAAALANGMITFTTEAAALRGCRFLIIAVQTPVDAAHQPDFTALVKASAMVGAHFAPGAVVVYESTVYPGATEEVCIPVVEHSSGGRAGRDFTFGYSPERINPGDREHTVAKIVKVVSGSDAPTAAVVAEVYGAVITAGVHLAASVKVAEAAKAIENTQRDVNIALMNEFAAICQRVGIDTLDVLAAAGSKWNFAPFRPGLVGGHCIGVDPFYLIHKAESLGLHPELIRASRRINDGVGVWIAQECIRLLAAGGAVVKGARVVILGLAFKEDNPDLRNTRVVDIITELRRFGAVPVVCDPLVEAHEARQELGVEIDVVAHQPLPQAAAVIVAVAHREFRALTVDELQRAVGSGPVLDVKGILDRAACARAGLSLWRL